MTLYICIHEKGCEIYMLGSLSSVYESNDDWGAISTGVDDYGGKSYGAYQLASNPGTVRRYINWLHREGYWFADSLDQYEIGSEGFDGAWSWLADPVNGNLDDFAKSQHDFIKYSHYDPAIEDLAANGFHIENHSEVMKDVVWSRAVQYGPGLIVEMFEDAVQAVGYPYLSYVDAESFDERMIRAIYLDVCSSYEWNSGPSRQALLNRFQSECNDALARL